MKIKFTLIFTVIIVSLSCSDNTEMNRIVMDRRINDEVLIGYCDVNGLKAAPFEDWYTECYTTYKLDSATLSLIDKKEFQKLNIKIFFGTWCSDSQREVPRFYKILDFLNYDYQKLTMIGVDTKRKAEGVNINKYEIKFYPTFVIFKDGKELGRIIESPDVSLEKDLQSILLSQTTK